MFDCLLSKSKKRVPFFYLLTLVICFLLTTQSAVVQQSIKLDPFLTEEYVIAIQGDEKGVPEIQDFVAQKVRYQDEIFNSYEVFWIGFILFALICIAVVLVIRIRTNNFKKRETELQNIVKIRTKELLQEKYKTELQAEQLKEMAGLKYKLFFNISRKLQTPLKLIVTPLEKLHSRKTRINSREWKKETDIVLQNSKKLLTQFEQFLEVSHIDSGNIELKLSEVSISSFLKKISQQYVDSCLAKGIHLHYSTGYTGDKVNIDKKKIEQVVRSLISNAVKFTPDNGKIYIHLDETEDEFIIEIKDSGIGIDAESLPKIFDPFYQVQESEGFGIGLSMAKQYIELHLGKIKVESILSIGTIFSISIPKKQPNVNTPIQPEEELLPPQFNDTSVAYYSKLPVNDTLDKTTILVVDDNEDIRDFITSILEDDFEIIESSNGKIAYEKILEHPPDLIISDILMPEMDGNQLNKLLKSNEHTAAIPFIFLTGKSERSNRIKGIKEGADVYLTKPFDEEELKSHVYNLLYSRLRLRNQILKSIQEAPLLIPKKNTTEDSFLKDLYDIIEKEYSNPKLSVNAIQERLFMSRSSFYRAINEKTGLNTQQFINSYRLQKAREMLMNEKGSISEIAYACGFNSLSYFSRAFKEKFKETPSQFLKGVSKRANFISNIETGSRKDSP